MDGTEYCSLEQREYRFCNTRNLLEYLENSRKPRIIRRDVAALSEKEQQEEFMFLGLRMNEGATREAFERAFGISIDAIYKDTIDSLKKQELLVVKDGHIYLSERGKDVANYVMSQF